MTRKIMVLEGPRLSGKSYLFENLGITPGHTAGHNTGNGPYWVKARDRFDHRIKDNGFIYRKHFRLISDVRSESNTEPYVVGKDVALTQRLAEVKGRALVDRYMITSAVYSHIFRNHPIKLGEEYIEDMVQFIGELFPELKERLHFVVLIPDAEEAMEETVKGREGKDKEHGMKDSVELLNRQIFIYEKYGRFLQKKGFKLDFVDSFHSDENVQSRIEDMI